MDLDGREGKGREREREDQDLDKYVVSSVYTKVHQSGTGILTYKHICAREVTICPGYTCTCNIELAEMDKE